MPRARVLTHELIGCWVVKANPQTWDYFGHREDEGVRPGTVHRSGWTVSRNYRAEMMAPGDLIVLWVTGRNDPGIYEIGRVTGTVYEVDGMNPDYAIDRAKAKQTTLAVPFRATPLRTPVPRTDILDDPVLSSCEQIRMPRVSNPTYLTVHEVEALGDHLEGRVSATAARKIGWDVHLSS
jgi:hypothetical protein